MLLVDLLLNHCDMNKISFFYKFFIINSSRGKYNWRVFLPFCGVIIGITTVALTFSIMEGMEYVIFNKLKNITFPAKITEIPLERKKELIKILNNNNIIHENGLETKIVIENNSLFTSKVLKSLIQTHCNY